MNTERVGALARIEAVWGKDSPEYAAVAKLIDATDALVQAHAAFEARGVAVKRAQVAAAREALAGVRGEA